MFWDITALQEDLYDPLLGRREPNRFNILDSLPNSVDDREANTNTALDSKRTRQWKGSQYSTASYDLTPSGKTPGYPKNFFNRNNLNKSIDPLLQQRNDTSIVVTQLVNDTSGDLLGDTKDVIFKNRYEDEISAP